MSDLKKCIANREYEFFPKMYEGKFTYSLYQASMLQRSHPEDMLHANDKKKRVALYAVHGRQSQPDLSKLVVGQLKQMLKPFPDDCRVSTAMFINYDSVGESFQIHKDTMDVFYVHGVGSVEWGFWESASDKDTLDPSEGTLIDKRVLNEGDAVYVPRGTYHHVTVSEPRVGFSFGIEGPFDASRVLQYGMAP